MSFTRFMILDVLGVAISVPVSIWFGEKFGDSIEQLTRRIKELNHILAFAIVAMLLVVGWRAWRRKRDKDSKSPGPPAT
jgi:membrane protein DedA with SNARE-associated domain